MKLMTRCWSTIMTVGPLSLYFVTSSLAIATPVPDLVEIEEISASGSGCPQGSVDGFVSGDKKAMTLFFDQFLVDSTESPAPRQSKNCNVSVRLKHSPGWAFSLFCVEYRGFAQLDPQVKGTQSTYVGFAGINQRQRVGEMSLAGPYTNDYQKLTVIPLDRALFSRCSSSPGSSEQINEQIITCSSSQGRYTECQAQGPITRVDVLQRLSSSRCDFNRSYGFTDNRLWVNHGCRARFKVGYLANPNQPTPPPQIQELVCSSSQGRYSECPAPGRIVAADVIQRYSRARCDLNRSYGFAGNKLWVQHGCRARFKVSYIPEQSQPSPNDTSTIVQLLTEIAVEKPVMTGTKKLHCASGGGRPNICNTGVVIKSARLVKQWSSAPCREGHSWGYDMHNIWVRHGCRGDFEVTFDNGSNQGGEGLMTVDSLDGELKHHYGIAWRRCQ